MPQAEAENRQDAVRKLCNNKVLREKESEGRGACKRALHYLPDETSPQGAQIMRTMLRERKAEMLRELFWKQAQLNCRTGFDAHALRENFDPTVAGEWLNNYIAAMSNELEELRDCTFWKHWCQEAKDGKRFQIHDLQNARVEVIDLLFFWISLAQCVGLDAEDVVDLYKQKLRVNHERQNSNYSMKGKKEDDNKGIVL